MKKNLRIKAIEWCQHSAGNLPLLHLNSLVNQKSFCGCPAKCIFWLFWADSWSGYCLEVPLWVCCWHWSATCWVAITVTLAIICTEEDHEPLSLLDLKRLGRPSPFGRWGRGVYSAKENGSSLFLPGDLVKIFVLYDAGLFMRWKVLYIFKYFLKNFVHTKSFPWSKAGFFWPLKSEENLPAETTNTVFHFVKPLLIVMLFNLMFLFFFFPSILLLRLVFMLKKKKSRENKWQLLFSKWF